MFYFKKIITLLFLSCLFFKASLATPFAEPTDVANADDVVAENIGTATVNNPNEAFDDVDGNGMSAASTDVEKELNPAKRSFLRKQVQRLEFVQLQR
ncbi:hypothetical protein M752DRAFT_292806 [Aspergillus phoenicis ATCC 13157]|uniref:Uncharacterized protein n=1 Tax=Aspergillus phoenicis ATCC 13157 TaxID=1353007 RepID=A0A370PN93_ASPPH|nr:hypothetical protein M752DRAFT_292806 [Aspergillus phoenicis ATCC 13157]